MVDPGTPVVRADDAGLTRGDGCFEGCRLVDGAVDKLDAHLARMTRSAAALEIPFDADEWRDLVAEAVAAWAAAGRGGGEAAAHPRAGRRGADRIRDRSARCPPTTRASAATG